MEKTVRWGILGLGNIAHKFAQDLALVPGGELIAVASRSQQKARDFADSIPQEPKYQLGSYEALFENDEVEVIYIATPHHAHKHWAIEAMRHGKHVLCEKPIGINKGEVAEMIACARENNVFLMEGLWSRFNPALLKMKAVIDGGVIGEVKYIQADFAFNAMDRPEESRVWNPDLAGGALLDIGIYPIFLSYWLLGLPKKIIAEASFHPLGVDKQLSVLFTYPDAHATLHSSFTCESEMEATIGGAKGHILIHPRWHETNGFTVVIDERTDVEEPTRGKGYTHEIEEVHRVLGTGALQSPNWSWENSLDLVGLMDEVRRLIGLRYPFEKAD